MLAEFESLLIVFFRVIFIDLYYLFFIGAIYFTLLNCKRKQWLLAVIFSLTGIGWLALYDMEITSGWLSNLGEDVLLELDGFTLTEAYFWLLTMLNVFEPRITLDITIGSGCTIIDLLDLVGGEVSTKTLLASASFLYGFSYFLHGFLVFYMVFLRVEKLQGFEHNKAIFCLILMF